jgi:hypothetical protein
MTESSQVGALPASFSIALYRRASDPRAAQRMLTWLELVACLRASDERSGKDGPMISPARLEPGAKRGNASVVDVCAFVCDFDGGLAPEFLASHLRALGVAFVIHSTFSSTADRPKLRSWIPLSRPIEGSQWPSVWPELNRVLALGKSDPATKAPSQAFYLPSHPPGQQQFLIVGEGRAYRPELPTSRPAPMVRVPSSETGARGEESDYSSAEVLAAAAWLAERDPDVAEALTEGLPHRGPGAPGLDRSRTGYMIVVSAVRHGVPRWIAKELVRLARALKREEWFEREWAKATARYGTPPGPSYWQRAKRVPPPPYTLPYRSAAHRLRGAAASTTNVAHRDSCRSDASELGEVRRSLGPEDGGVELAPTRSERGGE